MSSGVRQYAEVEQDAWLDQADQIRAIRAAPSWPDQVALAARFGGAELDEVAAEIGLLGEAARAVRLERDDEHVEVRKHADVGSAEVQAASAWIRLAHLGLDKLRASGDPTHRLLVHELLIGAGAPASTSSARNLVGKLLKAFRDGLDPRRLGLDAAFVAEGQRLEAALHGGWSQVEVATVEREVRTKRLHTLLGSLVNAFDELAAVRNLVEARSGEKLVGLRFAYLKGAAGPARRVNRAMADDDDEATTEPLPPLPPVVGPTITLG